MSRNDTVDTSDDQVLARSIASYVSKKTHGDRLEAMRLLGEAIALLGNAIRFLGDDAIDEFNRFTEYVEDRLGISSPTTVSVPDVNPPTNDATDIVDEVITHLADKISFG